MKNIETNKINLNQLSYELCKIETTKSVYILIRETFTPYQSHLDNFEENISSLVSRFYTKHDLNTTRLYLKEFLEKYKIPFTE